MGRFWESGRKRGGSGKGGQSHTQVRFRGPVGTDGNRVEGIDEISSDATEAGRGEAHLPAAPGEGCPLILSTFLGWHPREFCLLNPNTWPLPPVPYTSQVETHQTIQCVNPGLGSRVSEWGKCRVRAKQI